MKTKTYLYSRQPSLVPKKVHGSNIQGVVNYSLSFQIDMNETVASEGEQGRGRPGERRITMFSPLVTLLTTSSLIKVNSNMASCLNLVVSHMI